MVSFFVGVFTTLSVLPKIFIAIGCIVGVMLVIGIACLVKVRLRKREDEMKKIDTTYELGTLNKGVHSNDCGDKSSASEEMK